MSEYTDIFAIDIPRTEIGRKISIIGYVVDKKDFNNGTYGIKIKDITGETWCVVDIDILNKILNGNSINKGERLKIYGCIVQNERGNRVIKEINNINFLGTMLANDFSTLDSEMKEQAARMLLSRICKKVSKILVDNNFVEFETKLISNRWYEDSLEPLQVFYPGFGSPAYLSTSPAAQIIDFMTTTLAPNAFTISTSFASSYRFPNGSAETKVIVAKTTELNFSKTKELAIEIINKIFNEINNKTFEPNHMKGEWPDLINGQIYNSIKFEDELNILEFDANIPVVGKHWNSIINRIVHIVDKEKNLLVECSKETFGDNIDISSITIYPFQFLGLIEKAPIRNLRNLTRLFDGKN